MIEKFKPMRIKYTKDNGDESTRTIVSFTEVPRNIKALDISFLNEDERARLLDLINEYDDYIQNHVSTAFSFENWVQHTTGKSLDEPMWRTFKVDNIKIIE